MKKYVSIIIVVLLVLCFALVPTFISGLNSNIYLPEEDTGYEITAYDVDIEVNRDGSFDIKEKIDVHFYAGNSHGIYRWLPLIQNSSYKNANGKLVKKNFRAKVRNVLYDRSLSSGETFMVDRFSDNGTYFMQMGSLSYVPAGSDMTYAFSYTYDYGNDRDKSMDMLYYNIIGTGWDTRISNLTFSIKLPKVLPDNSVEFYVGKYGESTTNSNRVVYEFDGKTISGRVEQLEYGEAVTVFKAIEQGYFNYPKSYVFDIAILVLTCIVTVLIIILLLRKRKKHAIVEVVEFKAPEGITPAEAGLINDGKLTGDDISSLIVYWASKGFVKIKEEEKRVKIIKVAKSEELEGKMKEHEKILFNDMFRGDVEVVDAKNLDLSQNTGLKCKKSVEKATAECFDKNTDKNFVGVMIFASLIFALFAAKCIYQSALTGFTMSLQILLTLSTIVGICMVPTLFKYKDKCKKKKYFVLLILDLLAVFVPVIIQMFFTEAFCDVFGARFYLSIVAVLLVSIYSFLERYTERGREILGKIRGLKNYILVAEKDKMEMLVKDNPALFYDILPYAYVLGVSDVFMKKFEDVEIIQPSSNPTLFDTWVSFIIINDCLNAAAVSIDQNITAAFATRTGKVVGNIAEHIGGGFSGGGHGGGGGGRW